MSDGSSRQRIVQDQACESLTWHTDCRYDGVHADNTRQTQVGLEQVWQRVHQLEHILEQLTQVQARQIDRERNVPGGDPAELAAIDADQTALPIQRFNASTLQRLNT